MRGTCKTCKAMVDGLDANLNCPACGEFPLPARSGRKDLSLIHI